MILKKGLGVDKVYYLRENQSSFPGVTVERVFSREYRQGAIAAHLFGNVGEVTAEQLKQPRYAGLHPGDQVVQSGIEYEYDRYLRGKPGTDRVQVDALGRPTGQLRGFPAEPGDDVRLTLDSRLQATGDEALQSFGLPGAFVAMNAEGIITLWNAAAERVFGLSREEAVGRRLGHTIVPPRLRQAPPPFREPGAGRPTKRERREIGRLRGY